MDFNLTFICQEAFAEENVNSDGKSKGFFRIYESLAQDFLYAGFKQHYLFSSTTTIWDGSRFRRIRI